MSIDVTEIIIAIIGIMFFGVIIPLIKVLFTWVKGKTKNEALKAALDEAELVATAVVAGVQADIVDGMKENSADGKLTAAEAAEVMGYAVERFIAGMSDGAKAVIENNADSMVNFITDLIESKLAISKE